MHADRNFSPNWYSAEESVRRDAKNSLDAMPPTVRDLTQDLALETLLRAMAGDDPFLLDVARAALLSGTENDIDTILYRQEVVGDCIRNAAIVRSLYDLAVEAIESRKRNYWGYTSRYPSGILHGAVDMLGRLVVILEKLKSIAENQATQFASRGFTGLFAMLRKEFNDDYLAVVQNHLKELRFEDGTLLSAALGHGNEVANCVVHQTQVTRASWLDRILHKQPPAYTFRIHERDEAGARALGDIRNRGINQVANAVAQATEHIVGFFEMLKTELAFYICCLKLHEELTAFGAPTCVPQPEKRETRKLSFTGLYDVTLALKMGHSIVGNAIDADGKNLVIITGANQGGKSSFLRSVGLAQLMMQSGMFVGGESFSAECCTGLFTHYKREEDTTMNKGKLDEELSRLSGIVSAVTSDAMLLLNESFAATNEREGSEIAAQVTDALLGKHIRVLFVTHQYEFAHGFFARKADDALFLRAERHPGGTRTFKLLAGEPLETSYGEDVYVTVFGVADAAVTTQ